MPDWRPPMRRVMVASTGPEISLRASMPSAAALAKLICLSWP